MRWDLFVALRPHRTATNFTTNNPFKAFKVLSFVVVVVALTDCQGSRSLILQVKDNRASNLAQVALHVMLYLTFKSNRRAA